MLPVVTRWMTLPTTSTLLGPLSRSDLPSKMRTSSNSTAGNAGAAGAAAGACALARPGAQSMTQQLPNSSQEASRNCMRASCGVLFLDSSSGPARQDLFRQTRPGTAISGNRRIAPAFVKEATRRPMLLARAQAGRSRHEAPGLGLNAQRCPLRAGNARAGNDRFFVRLALRRVLPSPPAPRPFALPGCGWRQANTASGCDSTATTSSSAAPSHGRRQPSRPRSTR